MGITNINIKNSSLKRSFYLFTKNIRSVIIKKTGGIDMEITLKEILLIKDYLEELALMYDSEDEELLISGEKYSKFEVLNLIQKIS